MPLTLHPPQEVIDRFATSLNDGERRVLERLQEILTRDQDEWDVYVQPLHLTASPDFVLVSVNHGVTVVEVKDWSPDSYRPGRGGVEVHDRNRGWVRTGHDPLAQAERYRRLYNETLVSRPGEDEYFSVRATVVLPRFGATAAKQLIHTGSSIADEGKKHIEVAGAEVFDEDRDALRMIRGGVRHSKGLDDRTHMRLLARLAPHDQIFEQGRPLNLSPAAKDVAANPNDAKVRRVRGPAGSGKSVGLAARAAALALEEQSVLVLTFNITMAHYLQDLVRRQIRGTTTVGEALQAQQATRRVHTIHYHGFLKHQILQDDTPSDVEDWTRAAEEKLRRKGRIQRYDAVLVDEGQDFELEWWNLLRNHVVRPDGEMLLVADATQDIYGRRAWIDEDRMRGAGFRGPWARLDGTYRMGSDMRHVAREFATTYLRDDSTDLPDAPPDQDELSLFPTTRSWVNVKPEEVAGTVASRCLKMHEETGLARGDVVILAGHQTGLAVREALLQEGLEIEDVFTESDGGHRRRRKQAFWPGVNEVKGATIHSFKGWESRGMVIALTEDMVASDVEDLARLAYVAITRAKAPTDARPAAVAVVNAVPRFADFQPDFEAT